MTRHARIFCGTVAALFAAVAPMSVGSATNVPGLTSSKVTLGAIVTQSGPIASTFAPYLSGARAYFDYVNAAGGVNGRTIDLKYALDDASNPTTNVQDARSLVTTDNVFGIVGVSTGFFTSASFLAKQNLPVTGYATGGGWAGPKNFFAAYGSVLNYATSAPDFAYVATKVKATKTAFIALNYGPSAAECQSGLNGMKTYKLNVAYSNLAESIFGANFTADVIKMRAAGVNFVVSCMDATANLSLTQAMENNGMTNIPQVWLDGYDQSILRANANLMKNVYILEQHIPFESASAYPSAFPGLNLYLAQMSKYGFGSDANSDIALQGWMGAALFTQGLAAAGTNPTPATVITAMNKVKNDVGGPDGGVATPVNWSVAHTKITSPSCDVFVTSNQQSTPSFVPAFNNGSHVWVCFPTSGTVNLAAPVPAPLGTPGR